MIIIPGFKGGKTMDPYAPLETQTYQNAYDLDVYTSTNILRPLKPQFTDINLPTITGGTSIKILNSFKASNGRYYFTGSAEITDVQNFVLWSTGELDQLATTYTADYTVNSSSPGAPMDEFQDGLFFSERTNFDRWGNLSGSPSRTNIGTLDSVATHIRTHPGIGKIYAVHGRKIASYDGSTFTAAALTVDNGYTIIGAEPYGKWMVVGLQGKGSIRSRFLLWDGISTTVDDVIEIGETGLRGFRIVGGEIRYVTMTFGTTLNNDTIRLSAITPGGQPRIIQERPYSVSSGAGDMNSCAFSNFGDLFLYGFVGSTYDINLGIFAYGSGDGKNRFPTLWRTARGVVTGVSVLSIQHNGDNIIFIWSTLNQSGTYHIQVLWGNQITQVYPSTGVYESNIFPLNNGFAGKIKRIIMNHEAIPTGAGFTVQVRHYGAYQWGTSVVATESYQNLITPEGSGSSTGKTQSTNGAMITEIVGNELFKSARFAQLKILYDEINGANAPGIEFPVLIES